MAEPQKCPYCGTSLGSRSRGKDKFFGSYEDLRAVIGATDARGFWIERGPHKVFRSADGAVVGWWRTTKTISFQGKSEASHKLRTHMALLASHWPERIDTRSDGFDPNQRTWPICFEPDPSNDE